MTPPDHDPLLDDGPLDDDTLAVHAVIDDEATPEQRRRVARDPLLVARVAELRATVAAVATPVDPPPDSVFAELRRRALDALDEIPEAPAAEPVPPAPEEASPPDARGPVRDISSAPARRARRLPPLPAVAAVVVFLVLIGVGLLVAGGSGSSDQSADSGGDASASAGETVAEEGAGAGGGSESAGDDASSDRPSDAMVDELLAATTASYASEADLLADLQRVDPEGLPLTGSRAGGSAEDESDADEGESTTTASTGDASPSTAASQAATARSLAADPSVTRCDDVQRSAEPELEPATAAALVEVDGVPVLVLSNPVEVTDDAPSGIRLTALNALDCSPRGAVLR